MHVRGESVCERERMCEGKCVWGKVYVLGKVCERRLCVRESVHARGEQTYVRKCV